MKHATTLVTLAVLLVGVALAQGSTPCNLAWSTVDSGGETSSQGGSFVLGGTIGQSDAGLLRGGPYTLTSGFWSGAVVARTYHVYLPLVFKQE